MKKLILLSFALVFSVSSTFAYRSIIEVRLNGQTIISFCDGDGGNCLPTVEVRPEQIAQSAESNELVV